MGYYNFYIVGIGGSAGGLEALREMIGEIPKGSNAAFVLIQHLLPSFRSRLDEVLSKYTEIPVVRVERNEIMRPGAIYLLVENKMMTLKNGCLIVRDRRPDEKINNAIDIFFNSLAEEARHKAIAVVLSGSNADGSEGAKQISKHGGTVMVQDPRTADQAYMPNKTIEADSPEEILPPRLLIHAILDKIEETSPLKTQ